MLSLLILFMIISSGSILCSTVFDKKYEEVLPITVSSIILQLFLFGIFEKLYYGVLSIIVISICCYLYGFFYIIKHKRFSQFFKNFFTPGFIIFCMIYALIIISNVDKVPRFYDEFTHWADIVKVMTQYDRFGATAGAESMFSSYPPGTALLLYFTQKLHILFDANATYSEWRLYVAHQLVFISCLLPVLKNMEFKKMHYALISTIILFVTPQIYYGGYIYLSLLVDSLLGLISGVLLATIITEKNKDAFYKLYIFLSVAVLVLIKDAGVMFGAFIAVAYIIDELIGTSTRKFSIKDIEKKQIISILLMILAVVLPKVLWSIYVDLSGCKVSFSNPVELKELVKVFLGMDNGYRTVVLLRFCRALITNGITIFGSLKISYISLICIFMSFTYFVYLLVKKSSDINVRMTKIVLILSLVYLFIYIAGLCIVTFMFKFSKGEALSLASFDRYIKIAFLSHWMLLMVLIIKLLGTWQNDAKKVCAIMLCILAITPLNQLAEFVLRDNIENSFGIMQEHIDFANHIREYVPEDTSRIYYIAQETLGYEYISTRYLVRPNLFNEEFAWSIGKPFSEKDNVTRTITMEEWRDELVSEYDYVALFKINDYFVNHFGPVFVDSNHIKEKAVYKVDKDLGKLVLCE